MTRKDYEAIAKAVGKAATETKMEAEEIVKLAKILARELAHTNPNFKPGTFVEAICNNSYAG